MRGGALTAEMAVALRQAAAVLAQFNPHNYLRHLNLMKIGAC